MVAPYIFILGTGHSGGTLLNLLLGASPRTFAAGERLHLWNLRNLHRQDERTRLFWQQAVSRLEANGWPASRLTPEAVLGAGTDLWRSWINIVADISPQPVVVDKSNHLQTVRLLCDAGLVDPFFVHLVRDPRAVAHSYSRMNKLSLAKQRSWQISSTAISSFLDGHENSMILRYEDLAADPWHHTLRILKKAGERVGLNLCSGIPEDVRERGLDDPIFDNVIYGGNVMRHPAKRKGRMIELDVGYLRNMSTFDWATSTLSCLSGLRQFGYPIGRTSMKKMLLQS
ncbi:sulfotransferase [Shimia aestuarii]|uniref:Sulfotransferase family protein n=1 Tax=Shimia aestuarii TaxID=254406 RepID=A0A1I4Q2J5_9RHOB|nr:sulfotransferase [Shimia aestuarii]SFM34308.1 Sulfotransferase family protein [Shimia aestuarii]